MLTRPVKDGECFKENLKDVYKYFCKYFAYVKAYPEMSALAVEKLRN